MSKARLNMWYQILAVFLSVLLVVNGVPAVPVRAEEVPEAVPSEQPVDATTSLYKSFEANGRTYNVTVTYDEFAQIPQGAELLVGMPDEENTALADELALQTREVLALGENDRILASTYLDLSIVADGQVIDPAASVEVSIETDAIEAAQSASVELAMLAGHEEPDQGDGTVRYGEHIVPENLTEDAEGAATRLSFFTERLGTLALAQVVMRCDMWNEAGLEVSLLAPRHGLAINFADAPAPALAEGVDLLACNSVQVDPNPAYGTTLWIEACATGEGSADAAGAVIGYRLADTDDEPTTMLFDARGTVEPMPFDARAERLLLVWNSGYRSTKLDVADVTVEGMMPQGTQATVLDVTQSYENTLEVTTIAAYDITLEANGTEYQPDEKHPVTVTISNDAIAQGKDLQLWHVLDDGSVEVIEDYVLADGSITFEAPSFSTYLLVQQSEANTEEIGLSSTFNIQASSVNTYARTSKVTFVDEDGNPLMGTVTSAVEVKYTGSGKESNETNTVDVYSFADKLDPSIADEYEFSRVYLTLTATNQKEFRYIQVGDGTAINESANVYRAYFNMTGIEQNAKGQDFNGVWYQLGNSGKMDDVYIEFYHVASPSFSALDTRNDPVEGAEFALYVDQDCHTPLEYKGAEVRATSDKNGLVSFGKIPQGTYYMKETVIPEGYKQSTNIYTVVVDGVTPIDSVIHEDDDGSIIIFDVLRMKLTKKWDDGRAHENDSVKLTIYAHGESVTEATLNAENDWTTTIDGLDPKEAYMVSETSVISGQTDVTNEWIPEITYEELDPHVEYYKVDDFTADKQFIALTKTSSGTRALSGGSSLTTTPLDASEDGSKITGAVTDDMLWTAETVSKDGVIALKNVGSEKYLDRGSSWTLNPSYPTPLYVRRINNSGKIKFYHRANLNNATANYLYVWYSSGNKKEGAVDNYSTYENQAAVFDIYRKTNVRSVDVTITNKTTRYPVRIKNVTYPNGTPLPNMTFDLYTKEVYTADGQGAPLMSSLTAGEDGYLRDGSNVQLELGAGTYYLCQTRGLESEGYAPLSPLRFTITRSGALKVAQEDQDVPDFAYSTTLEVGETTLPVLQVPNCKSASFEVALSVEGDLADLTRKFEFALQIPQGLNQIEAKIDGEAVILTPESNTFTLSSGQTIAFKDVPATVDYVITQTSDCVSKGSAEGEGKYRTEVVAETEDSITVTPNANDRREVTISGIKGASSKPARVKITNTLNSVDVPATGIDDNVSLWGGIVAISLCALALMWLRRRSILAKQY